MSDLLRLLVMEKVDPVTDSEGPELIEVILNDDAEVDGVHAEALRDLSGFDANHDPVGLDVRDVVQHQA